LLAGPETKNTANHTNVHLNYCDIQSVAERIITNKKNIAIRHPALINEIK